jgi:hypothetical protein
MPDVQVKFVQKGDFESKITDDVSDYFRIAQELRQKYEL